MLYLRRRIGQSIQVKSNDRLISTITPLRRVESKIVLFASFGESGELGVECLIENGRAFNIRFGASTVSVRFLRFSKGEAYLEFLAPEELLLARTDMKPVHLEALLANRSSTEEHQHV